MLIRLDTVLSPLFMRRSEAMVAVSARGMSSSSSSSSSFSHSSSLFLPARATSEEKLDGEGPWLRLVLLGL
jgi:hypothetical protein